MNDLTIFIPCFVVLPLAAAFINSLLGSRIHWLSDLLGGLTPLLLFALSLLGVYVISVDTVFVYTVGGWKPPVGIALVVDGLTSFMLVVVNMVALVVATYARDYMQRYTAKGMFNTLWLLMIAGLNGVLLAGDLFNLYVFLEVTAVASYALVAFGTGRHELEAAFKYAVMGTLGSLFILLGIVFLYSLTSTLNMADMSLRLADHRPHNLISMVSVMFIAGFGLKAALVPFHAWLPDAHPAAPAPISAMLSGVLIKTLGLYALSRIFYNIIGVTPLLSSILLVLGTLSMIIGALLAIGQSDLKRLLAYSSISQIGYVVLGIGVGTPVGLLGALLHLFNHSVFKALLFLDAGAVEYATGTRDLRLMGGLAQRLPVTGTTSFVAALSIAGVPPFSGFWSKLLIVMALVQAEHLIYAVLAVLVSVMTLAMLMKVMQQAFFGELRQRWQSVKEVPGLMQTSMIALALLCTVSGLLLIPSIQEVFLKPATAVFTNGTSYAEVIREGIRQ